MCSLGGRRGNLHFGKTCRDFTNTLVLDVSELEVALDSTTCHASTTSSFGTFEDEPTESA